MNLKCSFKREFSAWVSASIDLAWSSLWIEVACSEGSLIWLVVCMVVRMSLWEGLSSVSS